MPQPAFDHALKTPQRQRVGGQPQVSLGLAAASRKPKQVGYSARISAALRVVELGDARQVEQHEGELERPPRAVGGLVHLVERGRAPGAHGFRLQRVDALLPHRAVGKPEAGQCMGVALQQHDAGLDACRRALASVHRRFRFGLELFQVLLWHADTLALHLDPTPVRCRQHVQ